MSGSGHTQMAVSLTVGKTNVPILGFDVSSGTYGSIGHATMTTSIAMLRSLSIDLVTVTSETTQVPVSLIVYANGGAASVFGGEMVSTDWNFASDVVTLHARDWAGILVDQRRVLTRDVPLITQALSPLAPGQTLSASGISTMNRKISQVVTDIANEFGFTPQVNMGDGTDTLAGSAYGSQDHVFMTIPQSLWSVLNTMARDTGNEVYTTPDKRLVFGAPAAGLATIPLSWNSPKMQQPSASGPTEVLPCDSLRIDHNPRRNNTFRVIVVSYDPGRATTVLGRATYIGDSTYSSGVTTGLHTGADAVAADKQLSQLATSDREYGGSSGSRQLSQVQLYTFHWDGLSQDAATARAGAIANSISKRLMSLHCRIDGYPSILPTQPLSLASLDVPPVFTANTWYTAAYRHSYRLPRGGGGQGGGYWTEITALDLPSTALAVTAHGGSSR